jgi:hypothetical protein
LEKANVQLKTYPLDYRGFCQRTKKVYGKYFVETIIYPRITPFVKINVPTAATIKIMVLIGVKEQAAL